jgi:flagellar operon protein (TIGR03826 family)
MSTNLRNCSICGRLFAYQQGRTICSRCMDQEEEQYAIVRKYVRDHPGATVFEVAEETGVEEEIILQFLRDGRLQSRGFAEVLECQRCGKIISSGKYCSQCLQDLDSQLKGAISPTSQRSATEEKKSRGDRMHTRE